MVLYPLGSQGRTVSKVLSLLAAPHGQHLAAVLGPVPGAGLERMRSRWQGRSIGPDRPRPRASRSPTTAGLVISEVMSKNSGSLTAPDGSTPDWIELYNASGKAINLKGYMLSDNPRKPDKYVFEAGTIDAGGYLLALRHRQGSGQRR